MDINVLPTRVIPTEQGVMLFGIIEAIYTLNPLNNIYILKENSGIIRNGFTVEFYRDNRQFFIEWKQ